MIRFISFNFDRKPASTLKKTGKINACFCLFFVQLFLREPMKHFAVFSWKHSFYTALSISYI